MADLTVVGSGIVGLAVAEEGLRRGLRVVVVEQDDHPVGASVRNFGHGCITAQLGIAHNYAIRARQRWLELRTDAGVWVQECGTTVIARSDEELAVLRDFCADRPGSAELLDPHAILERAPVSPVNLVGGAFLPLDIRVDPRQAASAIAAYLSNQGVDLHFRTAALAAQAGVLHTSRGEIHSDAIVIAAGEGLDRILPDVAEGSDITRCSLHMLRLASPSNIPFPSALLTGTSLLRYAGFQGYPSTAELRDRIESEQPALIAAGVNHMLTQLPSGDLIVGDTHSYEHTPSPFAPEELDQLLLDETRRLLGVHDLTVRERWRGVYAWSPNHEFVIATPAEGVRVVSVTSGIGMTTAFGLAPAVLDELNIPDSSRTA